jgi:outer membrane protein assembly factor BamD (BamD/ComL family)
MSKQPFAMVLYALATICLLLPVVAALLLGLKGEQMAPEVFIRYLPAAACVWMGLVAFGLLVGVGTLMDREVAMPRKLQAMLREVQDAIEAIGRAVSEQKAPAPPAESAAPAETVRPSPAVPALEAATLHRLASILEEIRDVSLLNEAQRQKRLNQLMTGRRRVTMAKVEELIAASRWREAEAMLTNAEQEFLDDPLISAIRRKYDVAKSAAEQLALAKVKQAIQDQIALSSWDRALELASSFAQQHPGEPAHELLTHTRQLREEYTDSIGTELYEEMRTNIEQRSWRRAYDAATRLLTKCPEHPKVGNIRAQLGIMKENAETEQGNAMEVRIQELVRAKRYSEAVELAEELQKSFPNSHQAEIASQLITKLRQRMAESAA